MRALTPRSCTRSRALHAAAYEIEAHATGVVRDGDGKRVGRWSCRAFSPLWWLGFN